jgi:hypothetical protein
VGAGAAVTDAQGFIALNDVLDADKSRSFALRTGLGIGHRAASIPQVVDYTGFKYVMKPAALGLNGMITDLKA